MIIQKRKNRGREERGEKVKHFYTKEAMIKLKISFATPNLITYLAKGQQWMLKNN